MAADFHAAPTELGLIYWPKSTNRSRLTALSICRYAGRLFNRAMHALPYSYRSAFTGSRRAAK
jgi:hypothetical protein